MNPTLISKLKSINPTEGEWRYDESMDFPFIETDEWNIDTDGISEDDHELITLAPAMRQELLKIEEERVKLIKKLDELIENTRKSAKDFDQHNLVVSESTSLAMNAAYKIVKDLINNPTQP
jgi:hypothetical protein